MSLAVKIAEQLNTGVEIVDHLDGLSRIQDPTCAAVLWQRAAPVRFQSWINRLKPEELPNQRVIVPVSEVRDAVTEICDASCAPACVERQLFIDDIVMLANQFTTIVPTPFIRIRLDVVTTNACKKFHVDYLTARMVCTYRGTGTQYGTSIDSLDPDPIFAVPTSAPLLMRGKHWPNIPASNVVHRSPQIEGTGETRFVLVFDPIEEV